LGAENVYILVLNWNVSFASFVQHVQAVRDHERLTDISTQLELAEQKIQAEAAGQPPSGNGVGEEGASGELASVDASPAAYEWWSIKATHGSPPIADGLSNHM
jgi:hypothetical protein